MNALIRSTKYIHNNSPSDNFPQYHSICLSNNCAYCENLEERRRDKEREFLDSYPDFLKHMNVVKNDGINYIPVDQRKVWRDEWEFVEIHNFRSRVIVLPGIIKEFIDDIVKNSAQRLVTFVDDRDEFADNV